MVSRERVRRAYDDLADVYAAQRAVDGPGMELLGEFVDTLEGPTRILDAGCGQGTPVLERLSESAMAVGLDFSREQLRLAADSVPGGALVQGDMTALPFESDSFDAGVAYWSLIHVPNATQPAVLEAFARVLRPGGRLLVCDGTTDWAGENPDWLDSGIEMSWDIAGAATTRDHLEAAGFAITDAWGVEDTLEADGAGYQRLEPTAVADNDFPWTFFAATLEE
ncbi:class I SAM-dependent methyltransferase [Halobacteria archaeon AArc-curdl1]|uniref:Class I SAM-dependent methyltransferase n=1 Tax=Natronosalvus hydrolyticus TaxID=2979988 RepID=A0AAP3E864_9EURY|nr:class I SAM-dependent methyltransferase [Halobacteria archaeon AArc-curdl1]